MTRLLVLALLVALLWSGIAQAAGYRPDPPAMVLLPQVVTSEPTQGNEATPTPAPEQDRMVPIGARLITVYGEELEGGLFTYVQDAARGLCYASYGGGLALVPGEECW